MKVARIVSALVFALFGFSAHAQDFVTVNAYIDNVQGPKNVLDIARDCNNNAGCVAFLKVVDSYFQIPASRVVTAAAIIAPTSQGEGTYVRVNLPAGYAYCSSAMKMTSIVPNGGPRGSLFRGASEPNALYYETWTPKQGIGAGRSWVEAGVSVLGVRQGMAQAAYSDGTCFRPGRTIWYCRGGGCTDVEDRGQSKDSSSPPGASSAK
jgi:hypothetical protein